MDNDLDHELRRRLRGLAVERPLSVDLWPAIAAKLPTVSTASPPRPFRPWALAAVLVMAVAAAWLVPIGLWPAPGQPTLVQVSPEPTATVDDAETLLHAYEQILAFEAGLPAQQWQRRLAQPGARERLAASRELDASLRDLAAALRIEPRSQLLLRLLHQTLGQRIAISRDVWLA